MSPQVHALQAAASGAVLYPFIGVNALPFALAVVLIDLDHLLEYICDTRDFSLRGFFVFYEILLKNLDKSYLGLSLFHTVEVYILGLALATVWPVFYYIVAGCLFHSIFDIIFLYRLGIPFAKAPSITDYLLRRKNHIVSIRGILRHEQVNTEGIRDIEHWKVLWRV